VKCLYFNANTKVEDTYCHLWDALFLCINWSGFSSFSGVLGLFRKQVAIVEFL